MKTYKRWFKQKKDTTQFQLIIYFVRLLIGTMIVLSLLLLGIVAKELYNATEKQAELIKENFISNEIQTSEQWAGMLSDYRLNSSYLICVSEDFGQTQYSSLKAEKIYTDFSELKQLFFLPNILWTEEGEPYYYTYMQQNQDKVTLLIDVEDSFEVIYRSAFLTVLLTFGLMIFGIITTYHFAKKFSHSLVVMNQEIRDLEKHSMNSQQLLTIPKTPKELRHVTISFNQLLAVQRQSLQREQQFVTDASHELRTPLAAIRGHVHLIQRRSKEHPEVIPSSIQYIDKESKRIEVLVEQLLLLGRLPIQLEHETVFLRQVIEQVLEELQLITKQEISLSIKTDISIKGSQAHFYQIVRNLIENAVKYTEDSEEIIIELLATEEQIQLSVADSGIGISDAHKEHIFERFYRVDQARASHIAGSGIGLSLVKELVGIYQGKIEVIDNIPKGTVFMVSFPL